MLNIFAHSISDVEHNKQLTDIPRKMNDSSGIIQRRKEEV
jgi:hypothetical protein